MTMNYELTKWAEAINEAPWGIQQGIKTALELVMAEDIKLCYGTNNFKGSPCLINALNPMISNDEITPVNKYPKIVGTFDNINQELRVSGVNTEDYSLSPLAAQVLLMHLPELKPIPVMPSMSNSEVEDFLALVQGSPEGSEIIKSLMDGPTVPLTVENDSA